MDNEDIAQYLAANLQKLRKQRNLSQDKLAEQAEMPRSTITHMESGDGNPSLANLCKIASALSVSIEELLSRPRRECTLLKAEQVPVVKKSAGRVKVHKLMPDRLRGIEIDRLEISAGSSMGGKPHLPGTKEYLVSLDGEVTVSVEGEQHCVYAGDILAFPGDQKHAYRNTGKTTAVALSVVLPLPYPT